MIIKECREIDDILRKYNGKKVMISTHENPDGDGLSACLALYLCLKHIYRAFPYIVIDSGFPEFLNFLCYKSCDIMSYQKLANNIEHNIDLLLVIDCHEESRVDTDKEIFQKARDVLVIDHHVAKPEMFDDRYAYYIDTGAVSTGVIIDRFLFEHVLRANEDWKKDYADCIYTTILNDTDNFLNSNTDQESFDVASRLMSLGLIPSNITNAFLYRKSIYYYKFIGQVLSSIEVKNKIGYYCTTMQMLKDNHQTFDAYSKVMRWTKGSFDVDVQVLFQEYENNLYRISLRSDIHDVAKIAHHFGGGGHTKAAGFQLTGQYEDVKTEVLNYIEGQIG